MKVKRESVPCWPLLSREKRIRHGFCIWHHDILLKLPDDSPYVLCFGTVGYWPWHCWLEAGDIVADLTARGRFFNRGWYYETFHVPSDEVKRFPTDEVAARLARIGRPLIDPSDFGIVEPSDAERELILNRLQNADMIRILRYQYPPHLVRAIAGD